MTTNEVALTEVMTQTADAISEKTGKSEKIKPVDFATEIEGITSGGGESSWRYFDCKQVPIESREDILVELQSMIFKKESLSLSNIMSSAMMKYPINPGEIVAFGADMAIEVNLTGEIISLGQLYETATDMLAQAGIVEITKEQFYDLNA